MPVNNLKVIQIIRDELDKLEQRGRGYREELGETIVEVIEYVQQNRVSKTYVQKNINDKVNALGLYLYKNRSGS